MEIGVFWCCFRERVIGVLFWGGVYRVVVFEEGFIGMLFWGGGYGDVVLGRGL